MSRRIVLVDIGEGLTLSGILPSVALHGAYNAKLTARGGVAPYTFTTSSELPDGLTFDRATGIFAASDVATAGTFAIDVTVTGLNGASITRTFNLQVIAQPLTLSGHAPDGYTGISQSYTYAAAGGIPPYVCELLSVPAGWDVPDPSQPTITMNADSDGTKTWTFRVTDAAGTHVDLVDQNEWTRYIDPIAASLYAKLVAWYPLDETSGTRLTDVHGGLHLTLSGTGYSFNKPTLRSAGTASLQWLGPTQTTALAAGPLTPASLLGANNRAIYCWWKSTSFGNRSMLFETFDAGETEPTNVSMELQVTTGKQLGTLWEYGAGLDVVTTGPTIDTSTHWVGYMQDAASKVVTYTVDETDSTAAYSNNATGGTTSHIYLGKTPVSDLTACGYQQDVTVFSDKLTRDERLWLYNSAAGRSYTELKNLAGQ